MEKVGKSMESTQRNYDAAMNKLTTGKGNLIRQAEQFRELGVQSNKKLDARLLQDDDEEHSENSPQTGSQESVNDVSVGLTQNTETSL